MAIIVKSEITIAKALPWLGPVHWPESITTTRHAHLETRNLCTWRSLKVV